ncbi:carboxymuconolactone decarboxylase family protein [Mycolicibacterium psychrotolerans]|uniref:Carboxymuconolactone decarboxylase n=1 Tax=Mycolicibacterium psychrotolerans TaxID=216929 RepID=A0A7I7MA89_9MYCO|nr:carboxymuconolactone decarboxylase family protein [Mycolicibacterium psychrotolerans]BBX69151.1 carboxymuconolactone decarboxylase [Mycolicibacterium psychrotolerans]
MRIPPLPADEWDDAVDAALSGLMPAERRTPEAAGNLVATLLQHPKLARNFLRFNFHLLYGSTLPPRLRELAVLRIALLSGCDYEWRHHVTMGRDAGLSDDDIAGIERGDASTELDRAVLAAVDELRRDSTVADPTWATLSTHLDEHQVMDLVFTIGCYGALAMAINSFGVQPDPDTERR